MLSSLNFCMSLVTAFLNISVSDEHKWSAVFLCFEENNLDDQPAVLGATFPFEVVSHGILPSRSLNALESVVLKSRVFILLLILLIFPGVFKLQHLMGSVAKAAVNCHIPHWFSLVSNKLHTQMTSHTYVSMWAKCSYG